MTSSALANSLPNPTEAAVSASTNLAEVVSRFGDKAQVREGQDRMVRRVAQAISNRTRVTVAAGTGTGKSLGYLVPLFTAINTAKDADEDPPRAVIVVSSIALQDQLASKDIPFVESVLNQGSSTTSWAVVKGRSRYVCLQKLTEAHEKIGEPEQNALFADDTATDSVDEGVAVQIRMVHEWADTTASGDVGELPEELLPDARRMVTASSDECIGRDSCEFGKECFSEHARAAAQTADIAVVNTHLFGADAAVDNAIFGDRRVIVIDEAHEANDILTMSFADTVSIRQLRRLAGAAARHVSMKESSSRPGDSNSGGNNGPAARIPGLVRDLRAIADDRGDLAVQLEREAGDIQKDWWVDGHDLRGPLEDAHVNVASLAAQLKQLVDRAGGTTTRNGGRIARTWKFAKDLSLSLASMCQPTHPGETVWVDSNGQDLVRVEVDIRERLDTEVWGPDRTVILTSATLPRRMAEDLSVRAIQTDQQPNEDVYDWDARSTYIDVGSPFDHRKQSQIYVPAGLPETKDPAWRDVAFEQMRQMMNTAEGRTLALFTSIANMTYFADQAEEHTNFRILRQGDMPKQRLLEEFTNDEHSCLFASVSFFTGVDVPGSSCSLVVIDKIPFPRPDDPLWVARRTAAKARHTSEFAQYGATRQMNAGPKKFTMSLPVAFGDIDVPRAAALLAQAAGRLIRSSDCKGTVMVLDPRLRGLPDQPRKWQYRNLLLAELGGQPVADSAAAHTFLGEAVGRTI